MILVKLIFRLFLINLYVVVSPHKGYFVTSYKWCDGIDGKKNIYTTIVDVNDKTKAFWFLVKNTLRVIFSK